MNQVYLVDRDASYPRLQCVSNITHTSSYISMHVQYLMHVHSLSSISSIWKARRSHPTRQRYSPGPQAQGLWSNHSGGHGPSQSESFMIIGRRGHTDTVMIVMVPLWSPYGLLMISFVSNLSIIIPSLLWPSSVTAAELKATPRLRQRRRQLRHGAAWRHRLGSGAGHAPIGRDLAAQNRLNQEEVALRVKEIWYRNI